MSNSDPLPPIKDVLIAALRGMRNGMYFGGKVRFFHALVIEFAMKRGDFLKKVRNIVQLTLEHGGRLGTMSFL